MKLFLDYMYLYWVGEGTPLKKDIQLEGGNGIN
jgi:hypothetical protein